MNLNLIKKLREQTGAGFIDCQQALKETNGDLEKALEILRKKGQKIAIKKQDRQVLEGIIEAYVHNGGRVGVLVMINCETDFVARNEEFKKFAHEIALQVAATNPQYLKPADIPDEVKELEREIYRSQLAGENKPTAVINKIIEGRLEKYYQEVCLLKQPYIKDDKKTVEDLLRETIAKIGENITIGKFVRFSL